MRRLATFLARHPGLQREKPGLRPGLSTPTLQWEVMKYAPSDTCRADLDRLDNGCAPVETPEVNRWAAVFAALLPTYSILPRIPLKFETLIEVIPVLADTDRLLALSSTG